MDFCFNDVAPHLHTMRAKCRLGFTAKKTKPSPSREMTSFFRFSEPTAFRRYYSLAIARRARQSRTVFVFALALLAGLRFLLRYTTTGGEAEARVRVRGRVVRMHRQRRQVRVVSVVTAEKATNRPYSAAALFQPHHLTGTPIPLCAFVGGMDFCFNDVAPHLHTMRAKCRMGFTAKKRGHPHRWR